MNYLRDKKFSFLMQNIISPQGLVLWGGGEICFAFYQWWKENKPCCQFPKCIDSSIKSPTTVNGIDLVPISHLLDLKPRNILITTINSQNEVLKQIRAISPILAERVLTLVNSEIVKKYIRKYENTNNIDCLHELLFDFPDESLTWEFLSKLTKDLKLKNKFLECSNFLDQ